MLKHLPKCLLITAVYSLVFTGASLMDSTKCFTNTNSVEDSLYCRGSRYLRNAIHNLNKSDKPVVIVRGLEIVPTKEFENLTSLPVADTEDNTFIGHFSNYLRTHELNIKFSELLAEESEQQVARDSMQGEGVLGTGGAEEARKKDKGQGLVLAMALMFGKMMAVMGLGGIGALAMKALGVAMAALLMAGIIGLKSLSQHGHESSHSVKYLTADEHHHKRRRRRSAEGLPPVLSLAYRGWQNKMTSI